MNKSTKRRLITSIICFTACASLVGVGFSLWTAGSGSSSTSGEGDLVTDDFSKIKINNSISVDPFCQDGFLTGEYQHGYELTYTGKIYVLIEFDLSEFVRSTDTKFDVTATLTSQLPNNPTAGFKFSNASTLSYGYGSSLSKLEIKNGTLPTDKTLIQSFTDVPIASSITNYYFVIDIGIVASNSTAFKENIYTNLKDVIFNLNTTYTIK